MKTAETIAQHQEMLETGAQTTRNSEQLPKQRKAEQLVRFQWKKGQSGNPGGRPKKDFAAEFARRVLEAQGSEKLLDQYANGFMKQLCKGNAYTFKELAERGYGKLKETVEHIEAEVADTDLEERVSQLERDLYPAVYPTVTREASEAARVGSTQGGTEKTNGKAKDTDVLPGNGPVKA